MTKKISEILVKVPGNVDFTKKKMSFHCIVVEKYFESCINYANESFIFQHIMPKGIGAESQIE